MLIIQFNDLGFAMAFPNFRYLRQQRHSGVFSSYDQVFRVAIIFSRDLNRTWQTTTWIIDKSERDTLVKSFCYQICIIRGIIAVITLLVVNRHRHILYMAITETDIDALCMSCFRHGYACVVFLQSSTGNVVILSDGTRRVRIANHRDFCG